MQTKLNIIFMHLEYIFKLSYLPTQWRRNLQDPVIFAFHLAWDEWTKGNIGYWLASDQARFSLRLEETKSVGTSWG